MESTSPNPSLVAGHSAVTFPIAHPVGSSNIPSPTNFREPDELDNLIGRVSTDTEIQFKRTAANHRKLHFLLLAVLLICLFIPGVNLVLVGKIALIFTIVALSLTLVAGVVYFKKEGDRLSAKEKTKIIFFECVKILFAPIACMHDGYKQRQRRQAENARFEVLGTAPDDAALSGQYQPLSQPQE